MGHTEGASGVISLIKIIMMMQNSYIPPQASYNKMSHYINVTPSDMMEVATSLRPWNEGFKAALINNYGASGSNASIVVTQSPHSRYGVTSAPIHGYENTERFPFWISGLDERSVRVYCDKLSPYLKSQSKITLADISFNMNRQYNRALSQGMIFSCHSVAELHENLSRVASVSNPAAIGIVPVRSERPVILCFGGQVSTFVGLDRKLYDSVSVLRHYLDHCDTVMQSLGLSSIYPELFLRTPIQDTIKLQTMLFAMQYACAKSWMDCGLSTKVAAVIGHSFGEITALCVSGILSLKDTIKLVAGRARLVRDTWGPDSGSMMAVEADEVLVHELLAKANALCDSDYKAEIACYNGPRSFTLAGSVEAINAVSETITRDHKFSTIKSKKLNVTNAFHSTLVEPLLSDLEFVGKDLTFNDAIIPIERATEKKFVGKIGAMFVPDHMRKPVYFNHALQRLIKEYPEAIFLEAGTSSTITIMASRALTGQTKPDSCHFQALSISNDKGLDSLTDATVSLWRQGLRVSFWAHHALQTQEYATLLLPPYQFEKSRHWLELKSPVQAVTAAATALNGFTGGVQQKEDEEKSQGLWTFVGYGEEDNEGKGGKEGKAGSVRPRFIINTGSEEYKSFVSGHLIAQTAPICPATLETDMAIEALFSLHSDWKPSRKQPVLLNMVNHAPICVDPLRIVWLEFESLDGEHNLWSWKIFSVNSTTSNDPQTHVEAQLHIRMLSDPAYQAEFARFERLVSHSQCKAILALDLDNDDVDILQGRNVYRAFGEIVDYSELYRGVRTVVGRGDECAGRVHKRHRGETWLDVHMSDCFSQVGGIWVNCMTERSPSDMYIATGCEMSIRSPREIAQKGAEGPGIWDVFARHTRQSEKLYMTDVFVFDTASGILTEVMLGIQYARVAKASMSKMLTRLTTDQSVLKTKSPTYQIPAASTNKIGVDTTTPFSQPDVDADAVTETSISKPKKEKKAKSSGRPDITDDVKSLIANVSGIEANELTLDSELADFGIDSLMGMELAREVEIVFKCTLDQEELMESTSLRKFVVCISNALFGPAQNGAADIEIDGDDNENDDSSSNNAALGEDTWSETSQDNRTVSSALDTGNSTPLIDTKPSTTVNAPPVISNLKLSRSDILQCFGEVKLLADKQIREFRLDNINQVIIAASNRLCAALVVEAFEELGCHLCTATAGQVLKRVTFLPQHKRLMDFVYDFMENDARLVDIDLMSGQITRTNIMVPRKPSDAILQELLEAYPEFVVANKLTYYAGKHLAGVLSGQTDGIRVIFGSPEGRELVQALYCDHTFNRMNYGQMRDVISRLVERIRSQQPGETLKILEMGAGTGGKSTSHSQVFLIRIYSWLRT